MKVKKNKKSRKKSTVENNVIEEDEQAEEEQQKEERKVDNLKTTEDEISWKTDIDNSNIKNDPEFTFYIGIFVEAAPEYYGVIELFNEAAVQGSRWKIQVISKEYVRNVIHNNLRSYKYKPFRQLCTQIISYAGYDLEEKIPTKLLAYFIMYEIRRLKNVYKQMNLYTADIEEEKLKRLEQAFNYDCSILSTEENDESVKITNETINDQEKIPTNEVYGTRRPESELSTRLEERDLRFIEDYPVEGPQLYIAITTIYDPQLPTELIEVLGVPVHCVVKVGNDPKKLEEENTEDKNPNQNILQEITNYYYREKRNKRRPFHPEELNEQKGIDISNFWSGLISKIQHPEKTSFYALTTLAIYSPSLDKIDLKKKDWKNTFKKLLYDEICHVLYNQYDLNVLYEKYMSSMEVTNLDPTGKCKLENMNVYNGILQHIPNESINVPIIFDSIIAQISALFGEDSGYEDVLVKFKNKKTSQKQSLLTNLNELNLLHDVLTIKDSLNDYKPRTILYGDTARLKSYHLGDTAKFITQKTFRILSLQYKNLFRNIKKNFPEDCRKEHMHVFRNVIGIRDRKKLSELLLLLAIIDRNPFGPNFHPNNQKTENRDESTDINYQYLIEDILNRIDKTKNGQNHKLIQNLNAIEEMHPEVLVQTLYNMSITHNTVEKKYVPLLDGFLFKFYNCPKNYYKTCVMQTPITLRDFIKYSLPEEKEWANLSLLEFQKLNIPKTFSSDLHLLKHEIIDPIDPPVQVTPILLIDSSSFGIPLKFLEEGEEQSVSSNNWEDEEKCSEVEKTKKLTIHEQKGLKHKQTVSKIYNVGPGKRMQFYSRTIEAMFRHGTKIRIKFQHQLYEKKMMNLELLTSGHRVYYNTNISVNEDPIKFLIHHRSGMILSFQQKESKKFTARFKKLTKLDNNSDSEADTKDNTDKDSQHEKEKNSEAKEKHGNTSHENDSITLEKGEELERCQIKSSPHPFINRLSTFSFTASWPSGYFMECNKLPNTKKVYIKHRYFTKGPSCKLIENELYRLNLPNNNVIKFFNKKSFEILFPTGKKIMCQKYFWKKIRTRKIEVRTQAIYEKVKREIVPVLYKIFHTDGRVVSYKDGKKVLEEKINIRHSTDVPNDLKVSEMANGTTIIQKNDASQVVEFNDGTRFTTVVQISPKEIFCDWPLEEKLKWFQGYSGFLNINDISDIEHSSQKKVKNTSLKKGKLENEGYVNITKTVFIEHPNFATTYNCTETKSTIIRFPMSTTIYLYSNGTYDMKFANGTSISIKKDRFVIDKFLNNSLFQHTVIMPHALKFNDVPDPPLIQFLTSDIHGNELKIDTTNFLHYRYALSEKNKFCLKHLTDNVNYFFLRRDMSGIEIFPHYRLAKIKEINRKIKDSFVQEFWNTPFKDAIFLSPTETISEEWIMPYSAPIASINQHNFPSTYGKSWVFPFFSKQRSYLNTPKILTMRVIKTFICEDVHKKILELIEEYKNMIDNKIHLPKCNCHKIRPWEHISFDNVQDLASILYKHGNIIIKTPDESFINYVKQYIVLHAARVAIKERKISKTIERYKTQRSAILNKQIPPYFSSSFGIAYLLTKEIRDKTNRAIEEMEYSSILDALLNKKINLVTENDIEDITRLLIMLKSETWNDQETVKNVLNTGKELQDNFSNMREVLKYHLGAKRSNDSLKIV